MKVILSHPTGNANVRAALSGFLNAGILSDFYTSLACFPGTGLDRLSYMGIFKDLKRREYNAELKELTRTLPWREIGRMVSSKLEINKLIRHEIGIFSIDAVYKNFDKQISRRLKQLVEKGRTTLYAYEDGAAASFGLAKSFGVQCVYDLPIGYWRAGRALLEIEKEKRPAWAPTLTGFIDSESKLQRKDLELTLADQVFVASSFTAKTLEYFPGNLPPINVIPFGFPTVANDRKYGVFRNRLLKILFVGGLSQRKGIAYLFEAVEKLKTHVELTVVGNKTGVACPALDQALSKHKWIPSLPHNEILELMKQQDVLVFPSLFEGFGLVITEAMSQGTPVITTDRTAGPDLIHHAQNGWLVDAGNAEVLKEAIEQLLYDPVQLIKAGKESMETARQRPWKVYGKMLAMAIKKIEVK